MLDKSNQKWYNKENELRGRLMYYRYTIRGIFINYDKYVGKMESSFSRIFPKGTTEEQAKKDFQKMNKDIKHYKDLSLFKQLCVYYEEKEEKIL